MIKELYEAKKTKSLKELALEFKCSKSSIYNILIDYCKKTGQQMPKIKAGRKKLLLTKNYRQND